MALYFAYGSNMWRHQMAVQRCPGAEFSGVGLLRGWRFLINARGVATIVPEAGWTTTCLASRNYSKEILKISCPAMVYRWFPPERRSWRWLTKA